MRRTYGALAALAVASCTLGSLDGLAGTSPLDPSGGSPSDALAPDVVDSAPVITADGALLYPSCATVPAGSPSGFYNIDPDGSGPAAPFQAYCDMTNDNGGWMLVTAAMLGEETNVLATTTRDRDGNGGLIMNVYVNSPGCSATVPATRHRIYISDAPFWTQLRYHQMFHGFASCWHTFGGQEKASTLPLDPNLVPFDATIDTIRDQVRMGGSNGDAFDGMPWRCDGTTTNFWGQPNGDDPRSATVLLRRRELNMPAGLETGADCGESGQGTSSVLFWQYSDIFVK